MNQRLITILIFAGALIALPASSWAAATPGEPVDLSLAGAVSMALRDNPQAAMAEAGHDMARARFHQAASMWLPQVGLTERWTRGDNPVYVFGSLLEQGNFGPANFDPNFLNDPPPLENYRFELNIRYPLFDQLRRLSTVSQSKVGLAQADQDLEMTRQALRLGAIQAYYGVLVAQSAVDVASQAVASAESGVEAIRNRFETGLVAQSDLLAAQVQLAELQQQKIQAEGNLAIARAGLRELVGLEPGQTIELTSGMPETTFDARPLDEQLRLGLESRPDLLKSALSEKAAGLQLRMARGAFLPRVDAFATFGASGAEIGNQNSDRVYGVAISLAVLETTRFGRLEEAAAGRKAAAAALDKARSDARVEIVTAWERFRAASQKLELAGRSVEQARESMRIINDRYQEGLVTITEQLRARTALVGAEMSLVAARSDYHVGYANLLRATGRLNNVELFTPNH